jgi:hypothetical protein
MLVYAGNTLHHATASRNDPECSDYFGTLRLDNAEAAALYGGNYQVLEGYNPDLDPNDRAALFQNACQINGFVCNLAVKNYVSESQPSETEFVFVIEFQTEDGELFSLGPCCGADPTESLPMTQFEYHVQNVNGKYVMICWYQPDIHFPE